MKINRLIPISLILSIAIPSAIFAENKVIVVPLGEDLTSIVIPVEEEVPPAIAEPIYIDQAIGKPIDWNSGWDQSIGHRPMIDPTVKINFRSVAPAPFGSDNAVYYTPGPEITHWGLQNVFNTSFRIYAKGVILVDKEGDDFVRGGVFEWSLNRQDFMTLHNITGSNFSQSWLNNWRDPAVGDKVWFFLMSDDERFTSNPITFTWRG